MSVSAITVNYFSEEYLPTLETSLKRQNDISEIIAVDNGSASHLSGFLTESQIIVAEENSGFANAVNRAIASTKNQWVLLVNPDVRLADGCLSSLLKAAIENDTPLVGPRFFLDDACQFRLPPALGECAWLSCAQSLASQSSLDQTQLSFYWEIRHDRFWNAKSPFFEPFLSGSCLLIDKQRLCQEGKLFDERFFLYYEDTDLAIQAQQLGYRPLCVPDATAVHYFDQSPDPSISKVQLMQQAREQFNNKYYQKIVDCTQAFSAMQSHWVQPTEIDLGTINTAPTLERTPGKTDAQNSYLEISLIPWFVPFAQTHFVSETLTIPDLVWQRLRPGHYFARHRSDTYGVLKRWHWNKA
ncbi:MAG: glycosyltransferase [Candidatus Thiodiazotropha sp.]